MHKQSSWVYPLRENSFLQTELSRFRPNYFKCQERLSKLEELLEELPAGRQDTPAPRNLHPESCKLFVCQSCLIISYSSIGLVIAWLSFSSIAE
uniref:Uncharacterized protein n=1 Tax=Anguilla anguilla TaxID=7936 RepID=A0A0E9PXJ8_ANGAN